VPVLLVEQGHMGCLKRIRDTLSFIWFAIKFAFIILVVFWGMILVSRWLNGPGVSQAVATSAQTVAFLESLDTVVKVIGGLFVGTWGLRFLDDIFLKNAIVRAFSLQARGAFNILRFFTFPIVHGDYDHLRGNTRNLLLFSGISLLMLPETQLFLLVIVVMMLVQGVGVWVFGGRGSSHVGASGMVLGFYSFIVSHGLLIFDGWQTIIAAVIGLGFGRWMWRNLTARGVTPSGNRVSTATHVWGFLGGIAAAYILYQLG
jgi:membrane associated rhomboid family serine protease